VLKGIARALDGEAPKPRRVVALWLPDVRAWGEPTADADIGEGSWAERGDGGKVARAMAVREEGKQRGVREALARAGIPLLRFATAEEAREEAMRPLLARAAAQRAADEAEAEEAARAEAEAAEGRRGPNISLGTRWSQAEDAVARGEADKAMAEGGMASRSEVARLVAARCPGRTWAAAMDHLTSHSIY